MEFSNCDFHQFFSFKGYAVINMHKDWRWWLAALRPSFHNLWIPVAMFCHWKAQYEVRLIRRWYSSSVRPTTGQLHRQHPHPAESNTPTSANENESTPLLKSNDEKNKKLEYALYRDRNTPQLERRSCCGRQHDIGQPLYEASRKYMYHFTFSLIAH